MTNLPTFKMVPDQPQLDALEREFRFFPCENSAPKRLSVDQIDQFNRDGFLTGMRIFDDREIAEHRMYFDELLGTTLAKGLDSYSISTAHLTYGRVYDLLVHRRIVEMVCDLCGDCVVGWGSHYFCKLPGDGKSVSWHQDASYWPLTPTKTITVWLAIDDCDIENGCMKFLPGTHRLGHLPYRESDRLEGNVLNQSIEEIERYGSAVENILKAGEISIHSDLLLHGSEANISKRRRCGLTLRYCPVDVNAYLDWNRKGVVVRGEDQYGHWENPNRPNQK